jgi:hypothetical protein
MMRRWGATLAAFALILASAAALRATSSQDVPALTGVWKLNVEASTNPNGPPPKAPAPGRRGGGGDAGGGGGGGGAGGGGGGEDGSPSRSASGNAGGSLSKDEEARFNNSKTFFFTAPPMMGVQATPTEFKMLLDPEKNFGFAHKTDNKKQTLQTPAGAADFKVKWDGKKLHREIDTPETLHVVEEYSLTPDGKQMIVTVKADSRMVFNVQTGDIRRVYDRQQ